MADLFKDIIGSIKNGKEPAEFDEKEYVPFIVNKAISFMPDGVLHANEMNIRASIPRRAQYLYLYHTIRKKFRKFEPWIKKDGKDEKVQLLAEFLGISTKKARMKADLYSDEKMAIIKEKLDKGGVVGRTRKS